MTCKERSELRKEYRMQKRLNTIHVITDTVFWIVLMIAVILLSVLMFR